MTWKSATTGKIIKGDVAIAKNYLGEKELSRLNRIVNMFIDYAELMAEDQVPMVMSDWLKETDNFLKNNRRKVLEGKGNISHEEAVRKAETVYQQFRIRQDTEYISEFDREVAKLYIEKDEKNQ